MKLKSLLTGLVAVVLMFSCATSNDVVSGRFIQKRKYNDGFYIANGKRFNKTDKVKTDQNDELVYTDSNTETTVEAPVKNEAPVELQNNVPAAEPLIIAETPEVKTENVAEQNSDIAVKNEENNEEVSVKSERKKEVKTIQTKLSENAGSSGDVMLVLLVILCFILPPLAVFLFEGATTRFWIDLILAIVAIGLGWWFFGPGIAGLCGLIAVIYALLIVLSVI